MGSIEKAIARLEFESNPAQRKSDALDALPRTSTTPEKKAESHILEINVPKLKIDLRALSDRGFLTPKSMQSQIAEEYRLLKRCLLLNAKANTADLVENVRLITVTSALSGEGKTFTAFNLAMAIANGRDTQVLLIDGDLKNRTLTELCESSDAPGLTDYLLDAHPDPENLAVGTNIPRLSVIPAGSSHRDSTELLASKQMESLAGDLSNRYDDGFVVLDAPPLLASMQALILASLAGQVLVVVEEGKTPKKFIKDAVSLLEGTVGIVGMVLNRHHKGTSSSKHNYRYDGNT